MGLSVGAVVSFTNRLTTAEAVLKAVVPPRVVVSALVPAAPVVVSQARRLNTLNRLPDTSLLGW